MAARSAAGTKGELRRELTARLEGLDPATARAAAARVAVRALELPELASARSVLACLSFGTELDTWGLVGRLVELGRAVYVPRAEPRDGLLHIHRWPCELVTLDFGLRQPARGTPELAEDEVDATIDAVLVLGLGFDRRGFRLGHGRGYFDRFFAHHPLPAIGLAFETQLLERLPSEPHDVPMRVVVTERSLVRSGAWV